MKRYLFLLLILCLVSGFEASAQIIQPYFVKLHSGEVIPARKIQLKSPFFKSNYFLIDDSLRVTPDMVSTYQNEDGFFARVEPGGSPDAFARRVIEGPRIDKFYTSRTTYDNYGYSPYGYGYGVPRTSRRRIYYFSKDEGPLYIWNFDNLQQALGDNAASITLLQKYRREKYINTGMTIVGAGLLALGVANTSQSNGSLNISPFAYAGAGVLGAQFVINLFQKDKLTQAVQVYNYQIQQ